MSHIDSDLEEGEIPDDSPSSPCNSVKKSKELPRRYILRENKSAHKHKKDCKYAIRYHAKKLSKLKKTPTKDAHKKHRKSCPHEKSHKVGVRNDYHLSEHMSKNGHSFATHSLIAEMKGSFKDLFINKQNTNSNISKSEVFHSETENKTSNDNFSVFESNKNSQSQSKNINFSNDSKHQSPHSNEKADDLPYLEELSSDNIKDVDIISSDSPKAESEESEDEEELRRIALATCAKRKTIVEPSENLNQNVGSNYVISVPESLNINVQIASHGTSNPESDNYEVVDMEVDEDIENSVDSVDNENLFVIDNKPSSKFDENVENSVSDVRKGNSSDEDFETDILRAELIGSMFRKKAVLEEECEVQKPIADVHHKQMTIKPETKLSVTSQKPNVNLHHKPLQPSKHILRKNGVNKSEKLKCNSSKLGFNVQLNKSPKRLIIALNGESSSEESDDSEEVNPVPENPVACIEALISDCRQKSDSNEKISEVKHVPKALSCLSKAQQEEYSSLVKILAEKKKLPASQETCHHNNGTVRSPLDDLKLLEEKLLGFRESLNKKKVMMTDLSKEVDSRKHMYMKSKLSAQHLKEQFVAAEKVRRIKMDAWSKSCRNFDMVKKSVCILESKIIQLQNLCSKVGSSIQGQTYNLPLLPTNNDQL